MSKSAQTGLLILAAALALGACNKAPKEESAAAASSAAAVDLSSNDPAKNPIVANKEPAASGFAP